MGGGRVASPEFARLLQLPCENFVRREGQLPVSSSTEPWEVMRRGCACVGHARCRAVCRCIYVFTGARFERSRQVKAVHVEHAVDRDVGVGATQDGRHGVDRSQAVLDALEIIVAHEVGLVEHHTRSAKVRVRVRVKARARARS